jgi:hypothetical protein
VGSHIKSDSGIPEGGHVLNKQKDIDIISRLEKVLLKHFGPTGVYILNDQMKCLDRTKDTIRAEDIEPLIEGIKEEFIKIIRADVEFLEKELREALDNN